MSIMQKIIKIALLNSHIQIGKEPEDRILLVFDSGKELMRFKREFHAALSQFACDNGMVHSSEHTDHLLSQFDPMIIRNRSDSLYIRGRLFFKCIIWTIGDIEIPLDRFKDELYLERRKYLEMSRESFFLEKELD